MTHKDYHKKLGILQDTKNYLEKMLSSDLPASVKNAIKVAIKEVDDHKIEKPELVKVEGDTFTMAEIKKMLTYGTGYVWKHSTKKEDVDFWFSVGDGEDCCYKTMSDFVADRFGVSVENKDIKAVAFDRDYNNRSELCDVQVLMIPGAIYAMYASDRASVDTQGLVKNKDVKEFFDNIG